MQLLPPSNSQIPLFQSLPRTPNPPRPFTIPFTSPSRALLRPAPRSSTASLQHPSHGEELEREAADPDKLPVVRRPLNSLSEDVGSLQESDDERQGRDEEEPMSGIDRGLNRFAEKIPLFEPLKRVEVAPEGRPLAVNLQLGLYKAKVLGRKFQFREAEKLLRECMIYWPEDGRVYVALGKNLCKQSKFNEAKEIYEKGCQATQGENSYIWQCWAVLENRLGNIRRARELFDAATVADKTHSAAWHGWAVLEIKEGNIKKARSLLGKGLKYCGGNEYIFQTLALLEVKGNRVEQARYLFKRATICNPKSCASWLAWAQLEMQQENNALARKLFERSVQASPKNRFAWHVWALFEAKQGEIDKARKLLKIGHNLNPRDPVMLQTMALLEYRQSSPNLARDLFERAARIDPKHQPIWMAWGWMEWKEGNIAKAREFYKRTLSIDTKSETAARCLQAWGVLEQRLGNLTAARRFFRSSLDINSQSYVTWMTWARFEEEQGNAIRAEEIRNLYFQQRTEVVDDASWIMGFQDIIDPAVDKVKRLLRLDQGMEENLTTLQRQASISIQSSTEEEEKQSRDGIREQSPSSSSLGKICDDSIDKQPVEKIDKSMKEQFIDPTLEFDVDSFVRDRLSIDVNKLDRVLDIEESQRNPFVWKRDPGPTKVSVRM